MTPLALRRFAFVAAAALSVSIAGDAHQVRDPGGAGGRGRLSGIITSNDTPVWQATVSLTGATWRRLTATTDPHGRFTFTGVPPDVYVLTASKQDYLDAAYGATRSISRGGMATGVALAAGQRIDRLALQLTRGGAISGVVREDGRPAAETMVTVAPRDRAGIAGLDRTNAAGAFRIAGLPRGDYDVIAYPAKDGVPVYYPGVTHPTRAEPVHVEENAADLHVELALVAASPVRVSGIVRDAQGGLAGGAHLSAMSRTGPLLQATTAPNGRFVLDRVPPGRYRLDVRAPSGSAAGRRASTPIARGGWAIAEIDVGDKAVTGLELRLQPHLIFSGRVAFDRRQSAAPVDLATIRVFLTRPGFHPAEITVDADGSFVHAVAPGLHLVSAIASGSTMRLRSALAGDRDLLDSPPAFEASTGDMTGVVLTFTDRETVIAGRVLDAVDAPAPACYVVVFPADRALWNEHSRRLTVARPSTDGRFVIRDLPPGDYLVLAVGDLEPGSWWTADVLSRFAPAATAVRIGEDGRTVQDLRIRGR